MMSSPGRRMMASLWHIPGCSAEGLQPSQGNQSAHRMGNEFVRLGMCVLWLILKVLLISGEERKVDQIVYELARYRALQETKWFGCELMKYLGHGVSEDRLPLSLGQTIERVN